MNYAITGGVTLIDEADLALAQSKKWHINDSGYAVWRGLVNGKKITIRLHRLINDTPEGLFTDHKNHNRLDNRRNNLRTVTQKENMNNYKSAKGYVWDKSKNKWMVRYKKGFYGRYATEEEAKQAYKLACSGVPYQKSRRKLRYLPTGVSRLRGSKSFTAKFTHKQESYYLGTYRTIVEAEKVLNTMKKEICQ